MKFFYHPHKNYLSDGQLISKKAPNFLIEDMHLTGKHVLNAAPEKVWSMLMDTEKLSRIVPGITRLEKTGDNSFKSILEIKMGPVKGAFAGQLDLEEIIENKSFILKVAQNSKIGNAHSSIKVDLLPVEENNTEISFDGEVRMSGMLAHMGHRVMGGVSHTLTNQFFSNMEKELETNTTP
jgi:carbon monoxide dehydrogenase subunit G